MGGRMADLSNQWGDKLRTAESLRTGIPQAHVDFSHSPPEEIEAFLRRINVRTVATAHEFVERGDFSSIQTLADVGGGGGGLAITLTKACPHIQATVIDLPQLAPIVQKIVDDEGAHERVNVVAADVVSDPVPGSYDIAVLRALLQVLSPNDARRVLQNVYAAINPGGTIYIVGQILDDSRTSPPMAVGFNLNFINLYEVGESYTEYEHREWLDAAGFIDIKRSDVLLVGGYGLITARKQG
jgi:SAM-dependent methyltransferase